jgi:hypothetical protein
MYRITRYLLDYDVANSLTDAYPPFTFDDDPAYPVRLALPEPQRLNRAAVFFRFILGFPANILAVLVVSGACTLMSFIAWLITLVAGRLPASFHQAFTAVVRFEMRNYAYWWMLTPAYPGGLFGDKPGARTWADQFTAPAPPAPGYGSAPDGYGAPYSPYAAPGAAPGPGGSGYPAGPGYGAPAGYGARPLFQPAAWGLPLTSGAKRLVTTFIVLGVAFLAADIGVQVAVAARSVSNAAVASNAIATLNTAHGTLGDQLGAWQNAVQACDQNLTCVTRQDAKMATDFAAFANRLAATPLPASAASAGARLETDATTMAHDFTVLSKTTTASQYESTFTSTGVGQTLTKFNTDYSALGEQLASF